MKLYFSLTSPFARKVRLTLLELKIDNVTPVVINPWTDTELRNLNPLSQVPTLLLDDDTVLYDSAVICEYLNELAGGDIVPRGGAERWNTLRQQALADGLAEATVRCFLQLKRPAQERQQDVVDRQQQAIDAALHAFEDEPLPLPAALPGTEDVPLIGELALASALGYLDLRMPQKEWRNGHPALAEWFEVFSRRPSMRETEPPRT
ncbi:MAG TPA: glutathione S-transferase family protein [Gammaproteobacteria bacterium]|jgi:glutathione S-transferase